MNDGAGVDVSVFGLIVSIWRDNGHREQSVVKCRKTRVSTSIFTEGSTPILPVMVNTVQGRK